MGFSGDGVEGASDGMLWLTQLRLRGRISHLVWEFTVVVVLPASISVFLSPVPELLEIAEFNLLTLCEMPGAGWALFRRCELGRPPLREERQHYILRRLAPAP